MSAILIPPFVCIIIWLQCKALFKKDHQTSPCSNIFFSTFLCLPLFTPHIYTHAWLSHIIFYLFVFYTNIFFSACIFLLFVYFGFSFLYECLVFFFVSCVCPSFFFFDNKRKKNSKENDRAIFPFLFFRLSLPMWYCVWLVT